MKKSKKLLSIILAAVIALSVFAVACTTVGAAEIGVAAVGETKNYSETLSVGESYEIDFSLPDYQSYYQNPNINISSPSVISFSQKGGVAVFTGKSAGNCDVSITAAVYDSREQNIKFLDIVLRFTVKSNSTPAVTKPGSTSFTSVTYDGTNNTLKWTSASNATSYQIARKKTGDSDYTYFSSTDTSGRDTNVTAGVKYTYQIRAKNGSTFGAWSKSVTVVTMTKPALSVSNKSNGIRAEWSSVRGATKYKVYYKSEYDSGWSSVTTSNTYYPLLNTVIGRKYAFQVQPIGSSSIAGPYSSVKNIVYKSPGMSVKPNVTLSNKSNGIRVEWNAVSGASYYVVYYCKSGASSWSSVTTKNNYYPFLSAVAGTRYNFQVLPMFGSAKGTYSSVVGIKYTHATNEKPEVSVDCKKNGIRVEWNKVSGATSYIVYYKPTSSSKWSSTTTANTYYPYLNTVIGTRYDFQVQPLFNGEKGAYSSKWSITFFPETDTRISAPATVSLTQDYGIDVNWSSVSGASGYVVQFMNSDTDVRQYEYISGNRTYLWINSSALQPGHYYYVWVRAYKQSNGSKYYGPWSSGKYIYYS